MRRPTDAVMGDMLIESLLTECYASSEKYSRSRNLAVLQPQLKIETLSRELNREILTPAFVRFCLPSLLDYEWLPGTQSTDNGNEIVLLSKRQ